MMMSSFFGALATAQVGSLPNLGLQISPKDKISPKDRPEFQQASLRGYIGQAVQWHRHVTGQDWSPRRTHVPSFAGHFLEGCPSSLGNLRPRT